MEGGEAGHFGYRFQPWSFQSQVVSDQVIFPGHFGPWSFQSWVISDRVISVQGHFSLGWFWSLVVSVPGHFSLYRRCFRPDPFGPGLFRSLFISVPGSFGPESFQFRIVSDHVVSVPGHGCICDANLYTRWVFSTGQLDTLNGIT